MARTGRRGRGQADGAGEGGGRAAVRSEGGGRGHDAQRLEDLSVGENVRGYPLLRKG
jgi:hypothetical protein